MVDTVYERGWAVLENTQLLQAAEEAGYDLLVIETMQVGDYKEIDLG